MSMQNTTIARQSSSNPAENAIEEFLKWYKMGYTKQLADCVQEICERNLRQTSIQALVTCRRKEKESLKTKLRNMNSSREKEGKPPFQTRDEIQRHIFDLAGVRIALYVPSQKEKVKSEVNNWFDKVDWVEKTGKTMGVWTCTSCGKKLTNMQCTSCRHKSSATRASDIETPVTPDDDEIYNPVFAGYIADHARVKLFKEQVTHLPDWEKDHIVEIQVVSVLLHAWAEVEHDITYKSIKAKAGVEEKKILDSLNGIIMSSELLLDQLYTTHMTRVNSMKKAFRNKFDLAIFLDRYIGTLLTDGEKNNLELKMLFGLLKAIKMDSQERLQPILEKLGFIENNKSSDLQALRAQYMSLSTDRRPFLLARHMQIPFYIMESILAQLSTDQEDATMRESRGDDSEDSYRCRILLSSFLWIGQLSLGGSIPAATAELELNGAEEQAFEWPLISASRFSILVGGKEIKPRDKGVMDILWNWFSRQEARSFFSIVFRISRLGVVGSFPDDLGPLRKDL